MPIREITDITRLRRINEALMARVERSMDQQGNAFSLFQTAITLESRVRRRTEELTQTLRNLENSNEALVVAKEAAEDANHSKTRFIAAASHDVLQPLNAAHLSISALADLQSSEEGRNLARQVERALQTMDDVLRTLIDISKFDAGVLEPDLNDIALQPLFNSLESDFAPLAAQQGLTLRFRPTDAIIRSDRVMYRRILQNIISNALRYTRKGGVLIGARRQGDKIAVNVIDTGIGISELEAVSIFEEFHRGPAASDNGAEGGIGLGLSIVRRMVDTLGHELSHSSRVGLGTVFSLKADSVEGPAHPLRNLPSNLPAPTYGLWGTRVLLVENDRQVLAAMTSLLQRWQCNTRSATNMTQALAQLDDSNWEPDLVIADQHLDDGDFGRVTILALRDKLGHDVPSLLVTADPSEGLREAARASQIEMMHKPVKPAELRALIAHLLA